MWRELAARDWLTLPEHGLRMFTAGEVYHDDIGLQSVRDRLAYYPRDVWLYLLVAGWWRVHPELNLVGRAGSVGDELGSTLIGSRLVSDLMRLCFLMERQYAPYSRCTRKSRHCARSWLISVLTTPPIPRNRPRSLTGPRDHRGLDPVRSAVVRTYPRVVVNGWPLIVMQPMKGG